MYHNSDGRTVFTTWSKPHQNRFTLGCCHFFWQATAAQIRWYSHSDLSPVVVMAEAQATAARSHRRTVCIATALKFKLDEVSNMQYNSPWITIVEWHWLNRLSTTVKDMVEQSELSWLWRVSRTCFRSAGTQSDYSVIPIIICWHSIVERSQRVNNGYNFFLIREIKCSAIAFLQPTGT